MHFQITSLSSFLLLLLNTFPFSVQGWRSVSRTRRPNPNPMAEITFDSTCKVACKGSFCMPSSMICKQLQGLHQCCGGISLIPPTPPPSPNTLPPPTIPPSILNSLDCAKTSPSFCVSFPSHLCCSENPTIPTKPPNQSCLFGVCTTDKVKLHFPTCQFNEPPTFGNITLTLKLYCLHINTKHRCCKKAPPAPTFGPPSRRLLGKENYKYVQALPDIIRGIHPGRPHTHLLPPDCATLMQTKSKSEITGIRRLKNPGGRRKVKQMKARNLETSQENDHDENAENQFCTKQPDHRCCHLDSGETPPSTPNTPAPVTKPGNSSVDSSEVPGELGIICENFNEDFPTCKSTPGCRINCQDRTCRNVKLLQPQCQAECSSNCEDICGCKKLGCEYHGPSANCRPSSVQCMSRHFETAGECRRAEHFYSFGGELCINHEQMGNCKVEEVIMAVNFGGDELVDSKGIAYMPGRDLLEEVIGDVKETTSQKVFGAEDLDKELYKTVIYGENGKKAKCVKFNVKLCQDGSYELVIKTLENFHSKPGKRLFTIKFGGMEVFPEVDILSLTIRTYYTADLAVNFDVEQGGSVLDVTGFDEVEMENGEVALEFCSSRCDVEDGNFVISAFSISRFGGGVGVKARMESGEVHCQKFHHLMCGCKKEGCEYNAELGTCEKGDQVCTYDTEVIHQCMLKAKNSNVGKKPAGTTCRRDGVVYSEGGVLCRNHEDRGDCTIEKTMFAVNINGEALTDSRGVEYMADDKSLYIDPWGTREERVLSQIYANDTEKCTVLPNGQYVSNVPDVEAKLYETVIFGKESQRNLARCISYPINVTWIDGKYELCLKFVEYLHKELKLRFFNVKFDDMVILPEFDILEYTHPCSGLDVIVPFEITEEAQKLTVLGGSPKSIGDHHIALRFCYGECYLDEGYVDPNFIVSAFYIAKMKK